MGRHENGFWLMKTIFCIVVFFWVFLLGFDRPGYAGEVILIGDNRLQPVNDVIIGVKQKLNMPVNTFAPSEVKGQLASVVAGEKARVVIALGREAIEEAIQLPESIAVVFDLVIIPPTIHRGNTTGTYMGTPVNEYLRVIGRYLPSMRTVSVVSGREVMKVLGEAGSARIVAYDAETPIDFINKVQQLNSSDALLLLPDASLLTASAIEQTYLFSFRKNIPLLGISEKHVRQGALFALVFDAREVGRQLGEQTANVLAGKAVGKSQPAPCRAFDLYVNTDTARRMGITIPDEMLRLAKMVYP